MSTSVGWLDWAALGWFMWCWISYSLFAKRRAKNTASLSSVLHVHRINWMRRLLQREIRVSDAALLSNLERNVTFFASSCVLVLAGLLTALTATQQIHDVIADISFAAESSILLVELKILLLIGIFIYAFFTFTWSMRQFGFASVLVGAAPAPEDDHVTANERRNFAIFAAKVIDQASHSYNYGLRAFYYSLAAVSWFLGPWYFVAAATTVVGVLFQREFRSSSLKALKQVENVGERLFHDDKDLYRRSLKKNDEAH